MAPAKALGWPDSIHQDPDVLSLDARGAFVLCRVCVEHYAQYGGKKPKRIRMNACFRTRAWETHKLRTRAHRAKTRTEVARPVHAVSATRSTSTSFVSDAIVSREGAALSSVRPTHSEVSRDQDVRRSIDPEDGVQLTACDAPCTTAALSCSDRQNAQRKPWDKSSNAQHSMSFLLNPTPVDELCPHDLSDSPRQVTKPDSLAQTVAIIDGVEDTSQDTVEFKSRCCDEQNASHNCYWATMRTLFSSSKGSGDERRQVEYYDRQPRGV